MRKWLFGTLAILFFFYAGFTWYLSGLVIHGPERRDIQTAFTKMQRDWQINRDSMLRLLPEPEEVDFTGAGQVGDSNVLITLRGWWFPADSAQAPCAMVMAHGFTDNRSGMLKYAGPYRDCGCAILMYDHRAHYQSGPDDLVTGGILESSDLEAAHRYVAERTGLPDDRIGWVGESWGGATALIAAGKNEIRPAFVAVDSPYSDWETAISERADKMFGSWIKAFFPGAFAWVDYRLGIDHGDASPARAAANIDVPTLIIHSAADVETSPDQSEKIYQSFGQPKLARLHLLDWNTWHAQSAARRPAEYRRLVEEFMSESVPDFCAPTTSAEAATPPASSPEVQTAVEYDGQNN